MVMFSVMAPTAKSFAATQRSTTLWLVALRYQFDWKFLYIQIWNNLVTFHSHFSSNQQMPSGYIIVCSFYWCSLWRHFTYWLYLQRNLHGSPHAEQTWKLVNISTFLWLQETPLQHHMNALFSNLFLITHSRNLNKNI